MAVVGAAVGAAAGYRAKKPTYQSVGQIRIRPTIPSALPGGQDRVMPAFEAFVKSQQAFLASEPAIANAIKSKEWQALWPGDTPEAVVSFRSRLDVTYDKGSEIIKVSFTDYDPTVAMTAVRCVILSYLELYGNSESSDASTYLDALDKIRRDQPAVVDERRPQDRRGQGAFEDERVPARRKVRRSSRAA